MTEEVQTRIEALYEGLDRVDYYEVLGVDPRADYPEIRSRFHDRAQTYHPDRFLQARHDDLRPRLYQVYKRMTEAYRVLSDPRLRVAYDACRAQGEHRLTPDLRNRRATEDERALKNPLARLYLASGRAKLAAGDPLGAQIDAELALSLEASPLLEDLHTQAVRSMVRPESRS